MKRSNFNLPDIRLLIAAYMIIAFGISMVYSSSINVSLKLYHDQYFIFRNQLFWLGIGTIFLLACLNINSVLLAKISRIIIFINIVLLILVLFPGIGKKVAGARRWISFKGVSFQPSEFIKISIIIYLATMFNKKKINVESFFEGYLPPLIVSTVVVFLILLEPDFGTAMLVSIIVGLLFYISGLRLRFIITTFFSLLPFAYFLITKVSYRKMRFLAFLEPTLDPTNKGYHILQSIKCFSLGGIFGKGIGKGVQKLWYLPQPHTDFIFSVIGEEVGLFGCLVLILLFAYMIVELLI